MKSVKMLAPELWREANANAKLVFTAGKTRTEELKEEKMSLLIPEVHVAPTPPLHPQTQTHPSVGQSMELPHANRSPFAAAGGGDGGGGRGGRGGGGGVRSAQIIVSERCRAVWSASRSKTDDKRKQEPDRS